MWFGQEPQSHGHRHRRHSLGSHRRVPRGVRFDSLVDMQLAHAKATKIFVNGVWMGTHDDPGQLVDTLRDLRRKDDISHEVSVVRDIRERELRIYTDASRVLRPVFIVDPRDMTLLIKKRHVQMIGQPIPETGEEYRWTNLVQEASSSTSTPKKRSPSSFACPPLTSSSLASTKHAVDRSTFTLRIRRLDSSPSTPSPPTRGRTVRSIPPWSWAFAQALFLSQTTTNLQGSSDVLRSG